jgi:anti-anti-sigma factor
MPAQTSPASQFTVAVTSTDASTVVAVRGEVDVATAPALRRALADVGARRHDDAAVVPLVIDLSGVTFMGAAGLGVLVGAARRERLAGSEVVLRDPSRRTLRVLEITRLCDVFRVEGHAAEVKRLDAALPRRPRAGVDRHPLLQGAAS